MPLQVFTHLVSSPARSRLTQLELSSTRYAWAVNDRARQSTHFSSLSFGIGADDSSPSQNSLVYRNESDPEATELDWLSAFTIVAVVRRSRLSPTGSISVFSISDCAFQPALAVAAQFLTFGLLAEGVGEQRWRRAAIGAVVVGADSLRLVVADARR